MPRFDVQYYNEEHRALLEGGPLRVPIRRMVNNGLVIDEHEILVHMVYGSNTLEGVSEHTEI